MVKWPRLYRDVDKQENPPTANETQINSDLTLLSIPTLCKHRLPKFGGIENQNQLITVTVPTILLKLPGTKKLMFYTLFLTKPPQR